LKIFPISLFAYFTDVTFSKSVSQSKNIPLQSLFTISIPINLLISTSFKSTPLKI